MTPASAQPEPRSASKNASQAYGSPLSAYETFQVTVADIAHLAELTMRNLMAADVLHLTAAPRSEPQAPGREWIALSTATTSSRPGRSVTSRDASR